MIPVTELVQYFSIAEWVRLCHWVDENHGKKTAAHNLLGSGWNNNIMLVGTHAAAAPFKVYEIIRTDRKFEVKILLLRTKKWLGRLQRDPRRD